jgi:hypothetical protein
VQLPQEALRVAPQLSVPLTVPQFLPSAEQSCTSVSGEHPQTFIVPLPPHVRGEVQLPQETLRVAPQLSVPLTAPQFVPSAVHSWASDSGEHPQTFWVPPPPHV